MIGKHQRALFDRAQQNAQNTDPAVVADFMVRMRTLGTHMLECVDNFNPDDPMKALTNDDVQFMVTMAMGIITGEAEIQAAAMLDRDYQTRNS